MRKRTLGGIQRRAVAALARTAEALRTPIPRADGPFEQQVLFVCRGNICRSPLAEGVFRRRVAAAGLLEKIGVDSAGTHSSNIDRSPEPRARLVAAIHGVRIDDLRARPFSVSDFDRFTRIVVFDNANRDAVLALARSEADRKLVSMLTHAEIDDPITAPLSKFERAYRLIDEASKRLLAELT